MEGSSTPSHHVSSQPARSAQGRSPAFPGGPRVPLFLPPSNFHSYFHVFLLQIWWSGMNYFAMVNAVSFFCLQFSISRDWIRGWGCRVGGRGCSWCVAFGRGGRHWSLSLRGVLSHRVMAFKPTLLVHSVMIVQSHWPLALRVFRVLYWFNGFFLVYGTQHVAGYSTLSRSKSSFCCFFLFLLDIIWLVLEFGWLFGMWLCGR